jgi:hemerythrin-like domain-containing protein
MVEALAAGGRMMSEVMTQLREEHRNIAKLLSALEHQLAIFDTAEQPDYDVLVAIAAYFVGFPDRCHHPKEDLIYRKMRERNPTLAQTMTDIEAEHAEISPLARQFWEAVQNVLQDAEISRSAFDEVARHFVRVQRRHMQMEEEHFFPLAHQILTPHDWAEIDERITREEDPVFGGKVPQVFAALRDDILKWEAEDEALEE